jgi:hypothetical protein
MLGHNAVRKVVIYMQAVQGTYDNGTFTLNRQAPVKTGKIIVIFNAEEANVSDNESPLLQDLLLAPSLDTKNWKFNREEANER